MIFIKNAGGRDYAIKIHHLVDEKQTVAQIYAAPVGEQIDTDVAPLGEGVALCHKYDNYNKAVGRRIAVARALQQAVPRNGSTDKAPVRVEFWRQYDNIVSA